MALSKTPSLFQLGIRFQDGTLQTTAAGAGGGTVTNTGNLTLNAILLGNGLADIKAGPVLPADATKYLDGTGNFTVPSGGSGTVTTFSAGTLSPLFTTSVANASTTPALSFSLTSTSQNYVLAGPTSGSGAPSYRLLVAADIPSLSSVYLPLSGGTMAGVLNIPTTDLKITNGSFATTIATAASANWTFTLPTTAGTNTYLLQTDGSGNTSWVIPPSGGAATGTALRRTSMAAVTTTLSIANSPVVGDSLSNIGSLSVADSGPTATHGWGSLFVNAGADTYAGTGGQLVYVMGKNIVALIGAWITRTTDIRTWIGLFSVAGAPANSDTVPQANYAAFRYSTIAGDTNWQCCTRDGTTQTVVDSGVAASTTQRRFLINCDDANSQILFYIDSTLVATISTNRPLATTQLAIVTAAEWHTGIANPILGLGYFVVNTDW